MKVRPLDPFGGEVIGVDLRDVSGSVALRRAIAQSKLLVFRGQKCNAPQFAAFLASLGPPMFTQGETPVEDAPDLNVVTNVGRTTPPRSVFHTDTSYVAQPPAFTALMAVEVPKAGGETLFTDQVRALDTLPVRLRRCIETRKVRHGSSARDAADESHDHPLVLRNPESDAQSLYLSTPERCFQIEGAGKDASERVVQLLYRHSTRRSPLYRHPWQEGDVIVWDNRSTMHRADHSAVEGDRTFYRGMVR